MTTLPSFLSMPPMTPVPLLEENWMSVYRTNQNFNDYSISNQ